jgi:prepilin-type processing-associated H-X9-DG protein
MRRSPCLPRRGFSLFQLLLVLAILLILLALLLPAVVRVRMAASRAQCSNNLKQLAIAMHNCNDTYGKMPPTFGAFPAAQPGQTSQGSLFFYILPFIEQQNVYNQAMLAGGGNNVWVKEVYATRIKTYTCPQDVSAPPDLRYDGWLATTSYAANFLVFGDTPGGSARIPNTFPDGTSNTIMFAERFQLCRGEPCAWAYSAASTWAPAFDLYSTDRFQSRATPTDCDSARTQALHDGVMNVAMADGSVRALSPALTETTWKAACTPAGGEVLGSDW